MCVLQFSQSETMRGTSKVNGSVESKFTEMLNFLYCIFRNWGSYYDNFHPEANQFNGRSIWPRPVFRHQLWIKQSKVFKRVYLKKIFIQNNVILFVSYIVI